MMFNALLITARAVHIATSILVAGTFTFDFVILAGSESVETGDLRALKRDLLRLALWSLVAAFLSAIIWFWLEVVNMSGLPIPTVLSGTAWQTVLVDTNFGRVWGLRLCIIAFAFVLAIARFTRGQPARRSMTLVLWFLSIVVLVSLAWTSHAAAARVQPLGVIGDALHLYAAGGWIGGLVPLTMFLIHARFSFPLHEKILRVLDRYTVQSLCCVSALVLTGISNSWLLLGSVYHLVTTVYGWLLLFKLAVFAVLLGFGIRNLFTIKTQRLRVRLSSDLLPQLRRNLICEACLGAAVLGIVACLGVTPPARHP